MEQPPITELLLAWRAGERSALDELIPHVQAELKRIARNYMRRQKPDHTLQTTALVNEAFLRLVDSNRVNWQDRNHFFAISAQLMRRILVDFARKKSSLKRGGDGVHVTLNDNYHPPRPPLGLQQRWTRRLRPGAASKRCGDSLYGR